MGIFRRNRHDEVRSHPEVHLDRTPTVFDADFDTRLARGLSGPDKDRLIGQMALWERVRSRIAPDEKRWAVAPVSLGNPGDPTTGARPYIHGYGFATDRRILLDVSTTPQRWEPEFWDTIEVPYSRTVAFGASREYGGYIRLIWLMDDDKGGLEIDNIHFKVLEDADFWDWYQTAGMLMKRDGGAEARPQYLAWLQANRPS